MSNFQIFTQQSDSNTWKETISFLSESVKQSIEMGGPKPYGTYGGYDWRGGLKMVCHNSENQLYITSGGVLYGYVNGNAVLGYMRSGTLSKKLEEHGWVPTKKLDWAYLIPDGEYATPSTHYWHI